jgi:hypothetical protein
MTPGRSKWEFPAATIVVLSVAAPNARAESTARAAGTPAHRTEEAPAATRDTEPAGSIAERVVAEVLLGSSLGTVGYLAGPKIVGAACTGCRSAAGYAGVSAAFPLGVYWGGSLVRGRGSFWLTIATPWLVSATTIVALARDHDYDGQPALGIGIVGTAVSAPISIALYELTSAVNRSHSVRAGGALPVRVALGPHRDGMELFVSFQP